MTEFGDVLAAMRRAVRERDKVSVAQERAAYPYMVDTSPADRAEADAAKEMTSFIESWFDKFTRSEDFKLTIRDLIRQELP